MDEESTKPISWAAVESLLDNAVPVEGGFSSADRRIVSLADGTKIDGVVTLRNALVAHPDQFVDTLTEKLLTYALGRGLSYNDMPVVRGIVRDSAQQNYRFTSIVLGIVRSAPFQMRMRTSEVEADVR